MTLTDLECFLQLAPVIDRLLQNQDVAFSISNTSEILYFRPGKTISVGHLGYTFCEGDGLYEAVHMDTEQTGIIPEEVVGVPFQTTTIPLHGESGEVIGVVGLAASLLKQNQIASIAESIVESFKQISAGIENITHEIQSISESHQAILQAAEQTAEQTESTSNVIDFIQNISSQTNILGLNASIEAARAGDYGRGFSVVAQEIRKLADSTKTAIGQIQSGLETMKASAQEVEKRIAENAQSMDMQAAATEEMMASVQELQALTQQLFDMAKMF